MMMTTDPGRASVRLILVALLPILILSLAGCGKKKIENPYEPSTLVQAVSGESANKLFKYELTGPQIVAVEGKLALLAEGDRVEFLVADDLSLLTTLDTGFKLGVRREWGSTPEVYLILEHVIDGPDTSFVTADDSAVFPTYQNFAAFDKSSYRAIQSELGTMGETDRAAMLRTYGNQGSKVMLEGALSRGEVSGIMNYYLETEFGKFQLDGVSPLGEVFLKAVLVSGGRTTAMGPLGKINRRSVERDTGVKGPLSLEYFQFQSYLVTNG